MSLFPYHSILLHQLPEADGWEVFGIKQDTTRELIFLVPPTIQEDVAISWANITAQKLAGKPLADID